MLAFTYFPTSTADNKLLLIGMDQAVCLENKKPAIT
jgi:hypothetical protein